MAPAEGFVVLWRTLVMRETFLLYLWASGDLKFNNYIKMFEIL